MTSSFPKHPPAFPPVPFSAWLERVENELGAAGLEALYSRTEDGIAIAPLYAADASPTLQATPVPPPPGHFPFVRGAQTTGEPGWDIRVLRDEPDPAVCAQATLEDLEGGATSVLISAVARGAPPGPGVRVESLDDLDAALNGVHLEMIGISLDAGVHFLPAAAALIALWERRGTPHEERRGELGADPLGALARHGALPSSAAHSLAQLADLAVWTDSNLPGVRSARISTLPWNDAGCTPAQELGIALATGVCYLRALTDAGLSPHEAAAQVVFELGVGAEQFQEIARLRAMRLAWARVLEECGVRDSAPVLNARLAPRTLTRRDPAVNMLRGTVACLTAVAGGAHSVIVPPFDAAVGIPNGLARRLARNTQHVLDEEAGLANVVDPAGGSWFVESLTVELARQSWQEFQLIEAGGGMVEELTSGRLAERIGAARDERAHAAATRARPITGVSGFANVEERLLQRDSYFAPAGTSAGAGLRQTAGTEHGGESDRPRVASAEALDAVGRARSLAQVGSMTEAAVAAVAEGAVFGDISALLAQGEPASAAPLAPHRVAEPFEALRDRSDEFLGRTGARPQLFIARIGSGPGSSARVAFTVNALAAGGIESRVSNALSSAAAAGSAFAESGCTGAVIAAADDVPPELIVDTARALRESGAGFLVHAGSAGERAAALREAGVREFLYKGCDVVKLLNSVHLALELDS